MPNNITEVTEQLSFCFSFFPPGVWTEICPFIKTKCLPHIIQNNNKITSCPSFSSSDYVFVTPVEVDAQGGYLTHDVTRRGHRSRRSLSSSLHYRLSAFGRHMHLDLRPSSVVGPGFTVQTLGSDGIATVVGNAGFDNCLYQGFIRNLSASSAAISTCSGLVSVSATLLFGISRSSHVKNSTLVTYFLAKID